MIHKIGGNKYHWYIKSRTSDYQDAFDSFYHTFIKGRDACSYCGLAMVATRNVGLKCPWPKQNYMGTQNGEGSKQAGSSSRTLSQTHDIECQLEDIQVPVSPLIVVFLLSIS